MLTDTTCYMLNLSPSLSLDDKTLHEVWTDKKPYLKHLKVFGCDAYVHFPKENMSELDNKAEKFIFNGYKYDLKCYKLCRNLIEIATDQDFTLTNKRRDNTLLLYEMEITI